MNPTEEQQDAVDLFGAGLNLAIQAGAGTGKTSTLQMLGESTTATGQYLVFNKAMSVDAGRRFPRNVRTNTVHSVAFRAVGTRYAHRLEAPRMRSMDIARLLRIDPLIVDYDGKKKVLQPSYLGSLVMRSLVNFCYSADKEPGPEFVPYVAGIDTVDIGGRRSWENNQIVRRHLGLAIQRAWTDLLDVDGKLSPWRHDVYLKIFELGGPRIPADFVLLDECFPAGTLVQTTRGPMPIEKIAESPDEDWEVLSWNFEAKTLCSSCVTASYKTPRRGPLVRIHTNAGTITATANHPIWVVDRGWVPAGLVGEGDTVPHLWATNEQGFENLFVSVQVGATDSESPGIQAVSGVWDADREQRRSEAEHDVLALMRSSVRDGEHASGEGGRTAAQDLEADEGRQDGDPEPDGQSRHTGEGVRDAAADRAWAADSGWERQGTNETGSGVVRSLDNSLRAWALAPRLCRPIWKRAHTGRESDALEDRLSGAVTDAGGGSGRYVSQFTEASGPGSTQDERLGVARVVGVEILESGSDGGSDGRRQGGEPVYTLSVETGCYFADGVLVKNCQDSNGVTLSVFDQQTHAQRVLVGDAQQSIYSWRGSHVNALDNASVDAVTFLSRSFRFGHGIADVANAILDRLHADLRLTGTDTIESRVDRVDRPDCILSRTNVVAMRAVLRILREGRRVHLVGGGDELVRFAKAVVELKETGSTFHPDLACFTSYIELTEYVDQDPSGDELALLVNLVEEFSPEMIIDGLSRTSSEEAADVVVSTAHRSKGREWATVQLAEDFPEDPEPEELRLLYVACTRAKHVLDVERCEPMRKILGFAHHQPPAALLPS